MKRLDLLRHLNAHGCEGGSHTVYINPAVRKATTIPRHREVNEMLVRKICKALMYLSPDLCG